MRQPQLVKKAANKFARCNEGDRAALPPVAAISAAEESPETSDASDSVAARRLRARVGNPSFEIRKTGFAGLRSGWNAASAIIFRP